MKKKVEIESDSGDDSAPEAVSFDTARHETNEQSQKINEQIKQIRESQKRKRKERQEKNIEQKKTKLKGFKLSKEILNRLNDKTEEEPSPIKTAAPSKSEKLAAMKNTKKTFQDSDNEDDVAKNSLSDFVPFKTFRNYGISVVSLKNIDRKPLVTSDTAKLFKSTMFNRPGLRRQSAKERLALEKKRQFVKSK